MAFTVPVSVKPAWWNWKAPRAWELAYDATTDGFVLDRRVAVSRTGEASRIVEYGHSWPALGGRVVATGRQRRRTPGLPGFEYVKPKLHSVKPLPTGALFVLHEQEVREGWGHCTRNHRYFVLTLIEADLSHGHVYVMSGHPTLGAVLADGTLVTTLPTNAAQYGPEGTTWADELAVGKRYRFVTIDSGGTLRPFSRKLLTNMVAAGSSRVWAVEPGVAGGWAVVGLTRSGAQFFRKRGRGPVPTLVPRRDGVCTRTPERLACYSDARDLLFELPLGRADRVLSSADGAVYVISANGVTAFTSRGKKSWSLSLPGVVSNATVTLSGELCVLLGRPLRLACLAT